MKKSKRIIGMILAIVMIASVFQTGLVSFAADNTTNGLTTSEAKRIENPNVVVEATPVTRVAASSGNPQAVGTTIVAATPSGVPEDEGSYAIRALANETASKPKIVLRYTNTLDTIPQIKCTAGGTGIVLSAGEHDRTAKTYTWLVTSGVATPGENIEFSITYDYKGYKYTNKAYSYVEGIAQPAGAYVQTKNKDRPSIFNSYRYTGISAAIRILGVGVYSSLQTYSIQDGNTRGYFRAATNSFVENPDSAYSTYGYIKTEKRSTFNINNYKSVADIYIDESTTDSLDDINLRMTIDMPSMSASNSDQTLSSVAATGGNQNASTSSLNDKNGVLGLDAPTSVPMLQNSSSFCIPFSGREFKTTETADTDTYTVVSKFATSYADDDGSWFNSTNVPVILQFHYVDKGTLRSTINAMLYSRDPESTGTRSVQNKGINPQSWYYSNGWSNFSVALSEAYKVLNNPKASQTEINDAVNGLKDTYGSLQLKSAAYKSLTDAQAAAAEAFLKSDWYTPESLAALTTVLGTVETGYSVIFQAQVDEWANSIYEAINNLVVQRANYTTLDAAKARAEVCEAQKSIYNDFSTVASILALVRANQNLTKVDQSIVTDYATQLDAAVTALVYKMANYTALQRLIDQVMTLFNNGGDDLYTNFNTVKSANSRAQMMVARKLPITEQGQVDTMVQQLQAAIDGLIPKPGDYTEIEHQISVANTKAEHKEYYSDFTPVDQALAACAGYDTLSILDQAEITRRATVLEAAIGNLVMLKADYDDLKEAIRQGNEKLESDEVLNQWSQTSIENLSTALTNAQSSVNNPLDIDQQETVDGLTATVNQRIEHPTYKLANYTNLSKAITDGKTHNSSYYTNYDVLSNAIATAESNMELTIKEQDEVDRMTAAINAAIEALTYKPADYSEIDGEGGLREIYDQKVKLNIYTDESLNAVKEKLDAVVYGLNITQQGDVDKASTAIAVALLRLVLKDANYGPLETLQGTIPSQSDLLKYYTAQSVNNLQIVLTKVQNASLSENKYKADRQADVDALYAELLAAIKALVKLGGDYTDVDKAIQEGNVVMQSQSPKISQKGKDEFASYVADIDRTHSKLEQAIIDQIAVDVRARYNRIKSDSLDESSYNAAISLNVSNSSVYPGQIVTVSVILNTDYYAASTAIPVLYDSDFFELVSGQQPTFGGSFAQNSITNTLLTSPDKGYPSSYTSAMKAKWKYVYVTITPDSTKSANAVMLNPGQTVVTFDLMVKNAAGAPLDGSTMAKIWIDPAFLKIESNMGGKLFVGRYASSAVSLDVTTYGQTMNLTAADTSLQLIDSNSPADFSALEVAINTVLDHDQALYTTGSYQAYATALADANAINNDRDSYPITRQNKIDAATQALTAAILALELQPATTEPLDDALARVPAHSPAAEFYTDATYKPYADAVAEGQTLRNKSDLSILDNDAIVAVAQAIVTAYDALTLKPFSYTVRANELLGYQPDSEYTFPQDKLDAYNAAHDALNTFMGEALTILNDARGLELIEALETAIDNLEAADTSALVIAVTKTPANTPAADYYTADTLTPFNNAIAAGNVILARTNLTYQDQVDIDAATAAINATYDALQLKPADMTALETAVAMKPQDQDDYYTTETLNAFNDAVAAGNLILAETGLTVQDQARINAAAQTIKDAHAALAYKPFSYTADAQTALNLALDPEFEYDETLVAAFTTAHNDLADFMAGNIDIRNDAEGLVLIEAVNDAYDALQLEVAVSALAAAVAKVPQYTPAADYYTTDTVDAFNDAVAEGQAILDRTDLTIKDLTTINDKTTAINTAYAALTLLPATTKLLEDAMQAARDIDSSLVTDVSYQALLDVYADGSVLLQRTDLTIVDNDDPINTTAQAIKDAIDALVYKPFSYTVRANDLLNYQLDPAYTFPQDKLNAYNTAHDDLSSFMSKTTLTILNDADGLVLIEALETAIDNIEAADTSALAAAVKMTPANTPAADYYTADTLTTFNNAVEAGNTILARTDLTYQDQVDIDAATAAINTAFGALTLKAADYTAVDTAIDNANKKLADMQTTGDALIEETVTALQNAINAVERGYDITRQADVDAMAQVINDAAAALAFVPKFEIINPDIDVDENGLLTGLKSSTSEADITACFKLVGDRKLDITPVQYDGTNNGYGTGTVVKVVDNAGKVYATYTIVVLGDYTGDGVCDAFDQSALTDLVNECADAATTAQMKAIDVCEDGYLDVMDLALIISVVNMEFYI